MIEIEDNAERCGLLSFSLLSQNHQKWRSIWECVPVSLSLVQNHRNAPVQHQSATYPKSCVFWVFLFSLRQTKSYGDLMKCPCLSLCLRIIKSCNGPLHVRLWLFCGGSDQKIKMRCSCLFCLFLFSLKMTKHRRGVSHVSVALSVSKSSKRRVQPAMLVSGSSVAEMTKKIGSHQSMCSLSFSLFFLKKTKNGCGAPNVSPALSLFQNYQKQNQHAMCRPGASVAEMTQRRRQKFHVFSLFLASLSLKYQTTIAESSWVLCFLPRE